MKRFHKNMTMTDALISTPVDPYGSMFHLLVERPRPPYLFASLVALFTILVLPCLVFQYRYEIPPWDVRVTYATLTTLAIAVAVFVPTCALALRLMAFKIPLGRLLALSIYSLTPLLPLAIGYYIVNYLTIGELSALTYFATGRPMKTDWYIQFLPYFVMMGLFWIFIVFAQGLRILGRASLTSGILATIVCVGILFGSYLLGLICSEMIFKDTSFYVSKFFASFFSVPQVQ
jgi:hypothetical protein